MMIAVPAVRVWLTSNNLKTQGVLMTRRSQLGLPWGLSVKKLCGCLVLQPPLNISNILSLIKIIAENVSFYTNYDIITK